MEAKFGPLDKRKKGNKKIDINRDGIFRKNSGPHPFGTQKELRNFGKFDSRIG
jgi:hypothetical protein